MKAIEVLPPEELDSPALDLGLSSPELELDSGSLALDFGESFELELDCSALDLGCADALDSGSFALDFGVSLELEGGTTELEDAGSMMVAVFSESFNTTWMTWILAVLIVSGISLSGSAILVFMISNMARTADIES
jgi:hypothetical protein